MLFACCFIEMGADGFILVFVFVLEDDCVC